LPVQARKPDGPPYRPAGVSGAPAEKPVSGFARDDADRRTEVSGGSAVLSNDVRIATAARLSRVSATLMVMTSAGGLLFDDLYRDNFLVRSGWYGNDLVTLFVAAPILVVAVILAGRGSRRAELVWFGLLAYTIYNYAFYLFGAAFNSFFLLYVGVFTTSIFALIYALTGLDPQRGNPPFDPRAPARLVAGYMLLVCLLLGAFWVTLSLGYVFTGDVPAIVTATGGYTLLIAALDLSMVVSFGIVGGIWLWKRRPWGFVVAAIWNVKGAVYMAALSAASVAAVRAGAASDLSQVALWGSIGVGCTIASIVLVRNVSTR
jgi:hypothetical protein